MERQASSTVSGAGLLLPVAEANRDLVCETFSRRLSSEHPRPLRGERTRWSCPPVAVGKSTKKLGGA